MSTQRSASVALFLAIVLPGAGQIYNRESKKGLVIFASCVSLGLFCYAIAGLNKIAALLALLLLWVSAAVDAYQGAKNAGRGEAFYYAKNYVVAMLLLIGPLALPLLWQSPNFSRGSRWIWSAVVIVAALLFIATPYLLTWLVS